MLESNKLDYLCVINLYNFDLDLLHSQAEALAELSVKPKKIIFVRYNSKPNIFGYDTIKKFLDSSKLNCEWRIQTMVNDDLSYSDILHNIINLNKKYRFIMSISNLATSVGRIVDKANEIVHENLKSFNVLSDNQERNAIIFPGATYRYSYIVEKQNLLEQLNNYIFV
jgi:hypothetical protein